MWRSGQLKWGTIALAQSKSRRVAGGLSWKVAWLGVDYPHKRYVLGKRTAIVAWNLYWSLRRRGVALDLGLYRGNKRVL